MNRPNGLTFCCTQFKSSGVKEKLKAEISHFSNIFFGKRNISKVTFAELLALVFCLLFFFGVKITFEVGLSCLCGLLIAGSTTKSAACCDV